MITIFRPLKFSNIIAYMLQNVEYQPTAYLKWLIRTRDFSKVIYRRNLVPTKAALIFRWCSFILMIALYLSAIFISLVAYNTSGIIGLLYGLALFAVVPIFTALFIVVPLMLAILIISKPKEKRLITASKTIFANTRAIKIAVAGSYGKTSMKEMLGTVLSTGKKVAITPANKNVASSHALFACGLTGDEEVLVVEFGEGKPGDVKKFSDTFKQDIVVITGIAPAHLDAYSSLAEAAKDIFSATNNVNNDSVFVNADSKSAIKYIKQGFKSYSSQGLDSLKVSNIKSDLEGLSFKASGGDNTYQIQTGLLGLHNIGPLCAVIVIAKRLGLNIEQIEAGMAQIKPHEHRMQSRKLANGAWIIDDTYNGNIEGIEAGLQLLKSLNATRKIYVTPGLVDQGTENMNIHKKLGQLIADCGPESVVLIKNSVTDYIVQGMKEGGFSQELRIETDPLDFYSHIEQFLADGDVVLMQNDWPDNYA